MRIHHLDLKIHKHRNIPSLRTVDSYLGESTRKIKEGWEMLPRNYALNVKR